MANFQAAPVRLLKHIPGRLTTLWKAALAASSTYTLFHEKEWGLFVPTFVNGGYLGFKGTQRRLIGMWGGQDGGQRLHVRLEPDVEDSGIAVELVSEDPVADHLWLWCVSASVPTGGRTDWNLVGVTRFATPGKPVGTVHAGALPLTILPEAARAGALPPWSGGSADETRDAVIDEAERRHVGLDTQVAYLLATVEHETGTWQPRRESWGGDEAWRRTLHYYPYYGRGYVQLTHDRNYKRASIALGLDLMHDPDLAMQPDVALFVLIQGVMNGWFGRSLPTFVNARQTDFVGARHSVNGVDRATHIAAIARRWVVWLRAHHPGRFGVGPAPGRAAPGPMPGGLVRPVHPGSHHLLPRRIN